MYWTSATAVLLTEAAMVYAVWALWLQGLSAYPATRR